MDQNNIILILLLIAVLVAFYAIYLAMENSKRIKKVSVEMMDLAKLVQESSNLRDIIPEPPINFVPEVRPELDEYPSMEEINSTLQEQELPLDDNLKRQIDNLEEMDEEQLLNLERQLEGEGQPELVPVNMSGGEPEQLDDGEEANNDEVSLEENVVEEEVEDNGNEEEDVLEEEEDVLEDEVEDTGELSSSEFPSLQELTEDSLNELNCEDLREICKREELRTRGRKAELVERILKKKEALL